MTGPRCYSAIVSYASSGLQNGAFSYIVLRVMHLMYTQGLFGFSNCAVLSQLGVISLPDARYVIW